MPGSPVTAYLSARARLLKALGNRFKPLGKLLDALRQAVIRHGGREALLARLGPEAQDGIDELLSQALRDVPRLSARLSG